MYIYHSILTDAVNIIEHLGAFNSMTIVLSTAMKIDLANF